MFTPANTPDAVELTNNGTTATFKSTTAIGVRSTIAVAKGPNSFYYFEAQRARNGFQVSVGVSGTAPEVPPSTPPVGATKDSLIAMSEHAQALTVATNGVTYFNAPVGSDAPLGFALDYRGNHPVVYVIGDNTIPGGPCAPGPTVPCVLHRVQLAGVGPASSMYIYAFGAGNGTIGPSITINAGADLTNNPFVYSPAGVRKALRSSWYRGDRGLNVQWPSETGPQTVPTLARGGRDWIAMRADDAGAVAVNVCPESLAESVTWSDENGVARGSGATLQLNSTLSTALGVGEHALIAAVTDPNTGHYSEASYRLTIDAAGSTLDRDGDELIYAQEVTAGTDPGDADTDDDGLSDGVEAAYGFDPTRADSDGNGTRDGQQLAGASLPQYVSLTMESGVNGTSTGVVLSDDGLAAAFTTDMNQDCVQLVPPFNGVPYNTPGSELCYKRAVRTNVGVRAGEFRYFETRRIGPPANAGQGVIAPSAQINPYCCFLDGVYPTLPSPLTPPSMSYNSVGGMFVQLVLYSAADFFYDFDPARTEYYGFAVDYTNGTTPIVYVVGTNTVGAMNVSVGYTLMGFNGADVMPMVYGHPVSNTQATSAVNLGLQAFHYNTATLRDTLTARGDPNVTALRPGIGLHRRPFPLNP